VREERDSEVARASPGSFDEPPRTLGGPGGVLTYPAHEQATLRRLRSYATTVEMGRSGRGGDGGERGVTAGSPAPSNGRIRGLNISIPRGSGGTGGPTRRGYSRVSSARKSGCCSATRRFASVSMTTNRREQGLYQHRPEYVETCP
jgi:hypothetical protein